MNFKEVFLKLTEYTTPFRTESDLESILTELVPGIKKDSIGNYHKIIGNSQTLFTCHLDNYCEEKKKVNHIIDGDVIYTDNNTILGADNKAGVCVLLYLISRNVPGHYCFFIGEEPILSGGCYGSSLFAQYYKNIGKYKRAIAFDRKEEGSIINRQMAEPCCSNDFVATLCSEFAEQGIYMEPDNTGYYTDTSSFLDVISECTNISVGVYNEHTPREAVDLRYTEKIAKAAAEIDWESLPSSRQAKVWLENEEVLPDETESLEGVLFKLISSYLSKFNFLCKNNHPFNPDKVMVFNHWFKEFKLEVRVKNSIIRINEHLVEINYNAAIDDELISEDRLRDIIIACKEQQIDNEYQ